MTVAELRELLEAMPDDMRVVVADIYGKYADVNSAHATHYELVIMSDFKAKFVEFPAGFQVGDNSNQTNYFS